MKAEARTTELQLLNQGAGAWEKLYVDITPYDSFARNAEVHFNREEHLEDYIQSIRGELTGTAYTAIRSKMSSAFLGSAISGLSQRRLSRIRSMCAALSRRGSLAAADLDRLKTVALDKWDVSNIGGGFTA
jgi:hypothetical protein